MLAAQQTKMEKEVRKALRTLGKARGGAFQQMARRYWNTYLIHRRQGHPNPHRSEELLYLARLEATKALAHDLIHRKD